MHRFAGQEDEVVRLVLDRPVFQLVAALAIDDVDDFILFVVAPIVGLAGLHP